jgi:arylformamidase
MKLVDLTHLIENTMPVYPGDITPLIEPLSSIEENGATVAKLILGTHTGTHADAPKHMLASGRAVHEIPLNNFVGDAWVFDFSYKTPGSGLTKDDLEDKSDVRPGDIIILYTGSSVYSEREGSNTHYVYISKSAADWLVQKKVKAVGIDSLSVERFGSKDYYVHKTLLRNDISIIENLSSNLKLLTDKKVLFIGVPLKLLEADGSPIRAFAVIW